MTSQPSWRQQRGEVSAELAILTPLLLVLILGAIQFGLWRHTVTAAETAAQEGARAARTEQGTAQAGQARAEAFLTQLAGQELTAQVQVTRTAEVTSVTITGSVPAIVLGIDLPVSVVVQSPTETFRPPEAVP